MDRITGRLSCQLAESRMIGEETPWVRAGVAVGVWEGALEHAVSDYEASVCAVAEGFERADRASWLKARDQAAVARRRIAAIGRGNRVAIADTLRDHPRLRR